MKKTVITSFLICLHLTIGFYYSLEGISLVREYSETKLEERANQSIKRLTDLERECKLKFPRGGENVEDCIKRRG